MGLLNLFKKKVEKRILKFEELKDWLDKHIERQELGTTLGIIKREISSKLKKLDELLVELERAQVKDPSVFPERALSVMEGNKKSYIQKIKNFTAEIKFPEKYDEFKTFLEEMSEELDKLATDTQKNFFVLKEFMEHEARAVSAKLGELDKVVAQGREQLETSVLDIVREIKSMIEGYYQAEQQIYNHKKDKKLLEETRKNLVEKKKKIEDKLESLQKGAGYKELQRLIVKEKELKENLKSIERKARSHFSDVEPALKKYNNKAKNKLVDSYLGNFLKTLYEDESMKLSDVLKKVEKEIDKLELKDSKLKKAKNFFKGKTDLKKLREEAVRANQEHEEVSKRIKNHSVRLNMKEQEGWVQSLDEDIEAEDGKIEEMDNKMERLNLKLMKQKIGEKIKLLDTNLELEK